MERRESLRALAEAARYDLSCACGDSDRTRGPLGQWIYPAAMPDGGTRPIIKAAQTSACERNCSYCALRSGTDRPEHSLAPEEMARAFVEAHSAGLVQGLFLSSAISGGPVRTMDQLLATSEILRRRHRFRGYLHLKIIPGCEQAQVERAMALATRVSVNLEVPGREHLAQVCPRKDFDDELLRPMRWIARLLEARKTNARSHTTQFVVGASNESDREIVTRAHDLYENLGLARAYYSKFQPVPGTPLENRPPTTFLREHRLYQADFLMRKYGYASGDIPFEPDGNLSTERDPKQAWADIHPEMFPLEVNLADREELLRVPGLGPVGVDRIIDRRRSSTLRDAEEMGIAHHLAARAERYLLFDGRMIQGAQLRLL
ncbi:MAG: putative DNA modification/repair radical SAM protein [Deltaproteobacteria bacterium]|nr:putative DNA modification/repair radical SAM protein [Deltaproteobacteria bacterium]